MVSVGGNECALLGLLAQKPRYGYELDKIIAEKLFREWTDIAFSSIYAILRGMEAKGLVESKSEIAGNRVRRQYSLTRTGRKALRNTVESMISEPAKASDDFMTAIANIGLLEDAEAKEALETRRSRLQIQLSNTKKTCGDATGRKASGLEPIFKRAELRVKADIDFIDWYLDKPRVKEESKAVEPEPAQESEEMTDKEEPTMEEKTEDTKGPELMPLPSEKPSETLF